MTLAARPGPSLEARERRFALVLLVPALLVLLLTTTAPLVYLGWNSLNRLDLGMPWLSGFAGLDNFARMGDDPRFWNSLLLTAIYTVSTVALQVVIGLSLALLVLQIPKGQGVLRIAAILPIVLAPVVVGLFWRTLVLAPDFGLHHSLPRRLGIARAKELVFSAREVGAGEALDLGLVYRIVEPADLADAAGRMARAFCDASPVAIGVSKALLEQSFGMDIRQVAEAEAQGQAICLTSDYHADAARRFLAKEPPRFQWPG